MPIPGLVWDSCSLLNLLATGCVAEIVQALGCSCYVVGEVCRNEVFKLRPLLEEGQQGAFEEIDFTGYIEQHLFQELKLTEEERETYIRYTTLIDDGEAKTAAVAVHRGFWVATDDRDAVRLLKSLASPIPALTTLHWLQMWEKEASVTGKRVGETLRAVRLRAHFARPRRREDNGFLCDWWDRNYPPEE